MTCLHETAEELKFTWWELVAIWRKYPRMVDEIESVNEIPIEEEKENG